MSTQPDPLELATLRPSPATCSRTWRLRSEGCPDCQNPTDFHGKSGCAPIYINLHQFTSIYGILLVSIWASPRLNPMKPIPLRSARRISGWQRERLVTAPQDLMEFTFILHWTKPQGQVYSQLGFAKPLMGYDVDNKNQLRYSQEVY